MVVHKRSGQRETPNCPFGIFGLFRRLDRNALTINDAPRNQAVGKGDRIYDEKPGTSVVRKLKE
jgi:hypothetical protein